MISYSVRWSVEHSIGYIPRPHITQPIYVSHIQLPLSKVTANAYSWAAATMQLVYCTWWETKSSGVRNSNNNSISKVTVKQLCNRCGLSLLISQHSNLANQYSSHFTLPSAVIGPRVRCDFSTTNPLTDWLVGRDWCLKIVPEKHFFCLSLLNAATKN